jgi:putative hemolysin
MGKRMLMILPALLALALLVGACGGDEKDETGLPNPASVYCEEQGGTSVTRTAADGSQSGVCVFADGSEVDEWAFYRGEVSVGG